jgi:hypothetical protein
MQELVLWIEANDSVSYLIITCEFCSVSSIKRSVTLMFISSAWMSEWGVINPYFHHITVTVTEKVVLEINFWIPFEEKLGLRVCFIQITSVRCHSAVQWPYVFIVGQWSMNLRTVMPCAPQNAIKSKFFTYCENALHIQYSYQTLRLAVATSWMTEAARARTHARARTRAHTHTRTSARPHTRTRAHTHTRARAHTHTHAHTRAHATRSLSLSLSVNWQLNMKKGSESKHHTSMTDNKYNRHDIRVKECSTIQFASAKQ